MNWTLYPSPAVAGKVARTLVLAHRNGEDTCRYGESQRYSSQKSWLKDRYRTGTVDTADTTDPGLCDHENCIYICWEIPPVLPMLFASTVTPFALRPNVGALVRSSTLPEPT